VPAAERSPVLHVSTSESFALPASFWVPVKHTPYADHGADTAPFSLTITAPPGLKVISSGIRKSEQAFEQSLAALPFFIIGDYEVTTRGNEATEAEIYAPRGLDEAGKQQVKRLADEVARIVAFYAKYFGVPPSVPLRVISTQARELAFATTGAVTVDDSLFRREVLDLGTIELLASAAAKAWIDGRVLLRGRGAGMLRDALPVYLAALYLGERFGEAQREAAFERYRRAYAPLARGSDSSLLMQSPLDRNYTTSLYNKGALIWRLLEKRLGSQAFNVLIRQMLDRQRVDVLSLAEWKGPLCGLSRCVNVKGALLAAADRNLINETFAQWIETVVLPDFAIGQPQPTANGIESTVANFGSGDFTIEVLATTDQGEKLRQSVKVKSGEFGSVTFPAGTRIAAIEADPEKVYLQKDYTNDAFPRRASSEILYGQASLAFSKGDLATAEAKVREALSAEPSAPTLQALLGRVLLVQNKRDEALRIFTAVLKSEPIPIQAYGWAHLGAGELALQQNSFAEAARHFRFAAASELDPATTLAARDGALRAERGANAIKITDEVRGFLQRFDAAILQGSADAINQMLEQGNLQKFAKSLVGNKPAAWTTEALRAEDWDANRVAVDVSLKVKVIGKDYSGRALYVINRAGGSLRLSEVPIFDVK
jgi:tetratricopeptide (TPR) repeat protein